MTLLTLIVINAFLCVAVVYGIVTLLSFGIRSDASPANVVHQLRPARRDEARRAA